MAFLVIAFDLWDAEKELGAFNHENSSLRRVLIQISIVGIPDLVILWIQILIFYTSSQ